jgi:very-short-patch-repair endonuclease
LSVALIADAVGARQHGAVHLDQLVDGGASIDEIRRAADRHELIRVAPQVFVTAGSPRTWRQRLMVAVLDAGPGACVSHRAAAILHGFARRGMPEVVEITAPRTRSERIEGVIVHKPLDLRADRDITVVDGIPCTSVLRTLVDYGVSETWLEVWDAIERAIQDDLVTHRGCEWMLATLSKQGRTGCGPFRRALDERALKMKAPHKGLLEPRMAGVARRFKLPAYAYQHDVFGDGSVLIDFAFVAQKVAVEVKGLKDRLNPKKLTEDFEREHRLVAAGWVVLSFTWHQVVRRPKYVADQILQVLVARSGATRR